ncbi:hypothetical protein KIN20_001602 [Parelaphostrongylus tenuis]|uniref:Protein kinase domain-containing protein n=1 Tax=Parelaphostrongylus tenuis TaxID=148309 RepID=A0AAD5LYK1_PARTN|nr:hypothetical protein KIN20_001602 [Parelaphostrongylus tenuis]
MSKARIKYMMREARLVRNFEHKNIVRLYGVAQRESLRYFYVEWEQSMYEHFVSDSPPKNKASDRHASAELAKEYGQIMRAHSCQKTVKFTSETLRKDRYMAYRYRSPKKPWSSTVIMTILRAIHDT